MNDEQTSVDAGVGLATRLRHIAARAIIAYVRLVRRTSRLVTSPEQLAATFAANEPFILAGWHGSYLLAPVLYPDPTRISAIVARHGDAEVSGFVLQHFGLQLVRGSGAGGKRKDKGGATALRTMLRELRAGRTVTLTADMPPGPAREAGLGVITLARMSGRPILPAVIASSNFTVLNTWSRFIVNLPFSRIAVVTGEPVFVAAGAGAAEMDRLRLELQSRLEQLHREAYAAVGAGADALVRIGAEGPPQPGWQLRVYRALMTAAEPLAGWFLGRRVRQGKEDPARLGERRGLAGVARPAGRLVWLHAASVGETNAVLPLMVRLSELYPQTRLLLTSGTLTSAQIAAARLPDGAIHQFVPLDGPSFVRRFLDHWRPDLVVFVESEIWPNLVLESASRHIPLVLLNATISNRSFRRWRRRPGISRPLFGRFGLVLAQNQTLRVRFARLGARRVVNIGNLKLDAPPPPVDAPGLAQWRAAVGDRKVFLAASTHDGEEQQVVAAHLLARKALPGLLTVIVPRHPERGGQVATMVTARGLGCCRRSEGRMPEAGCDIYIADTLGELGLFYAAVRLALIGGTLVPVGGHNPIEAVQHGAAVLTGPHWFRQEDTFGPLLQAGGAVEVSDSEQLAETLVGWLSDDQKLDAVKLAALQTTAELTGALQRALDALAPYLDEKGDSTDAA